MKKVFLTSDMGCSKKENGIRCCTKINNENKIIEQIKESLDNENTFVFITSNPDDYKTNDNYANLTFNSFNISGFDFKKLIIIDNRYLNNLENTIKNSDLIFLAGGNTEIEMNFFEKIKLREILKNYNGVIIGQSAGAINLANIAVCSPEYEEEIGKKYVWPGLEKTNINIEPHFHLETNNPLEEKLRKELLSLSEKYNIYAIKDGTHIFDNGKEITLYGEAYLIKNKIITKISDIGNNISIKKQFNRLIK